MTRVDQRGTNGGGPQRAATAAPLTNGRTDVNDRVYRTIAEVASAELIGVARKAVKIDVVEQGTALALAIATPLPVPDLNDTAAIVAEMPVLDRARALQERLQRRLTEILGRDVARITMTITGATVPERRRVQ